MNMKKIIFNCNRKRNHQICIKINKKKKFKLIIEFLSRIQAQDYTDIFKEFKTC
jgi:hypothetical protein